MEGIGSPLPLSPDEQRQLRLVRALVYVLPPVIGLLTFPILISVETLLGSANSLGDTVMVVVFWLNVFLAGAGAACAVAWLHPIRAGAWWRAAAAFGFAIIGALVFFLGTARIAASLGYHL